MRKSSAATEQLLRLRHAEQAERLGTISYQHSDRDENYYLLDDADLRRTYGRLIGRLAYSHWWPANELPSQFNDIIGAFPGGPSDWTIDPLKLALVVRAADACHLDARRAPDFCEHCASRLESLKSIGGFRNMCRYPMRTLAAWSSAPRTIFRSKTSRFGGSATRCSTWPMMKLHRADMILRDTGRRAFAVNGVAGANDPARLTRHLRTRAWKPVPTKIQVSDVPTLVRSLGGTGLYGENPRVPLREVDPECGMPSSHGE